MTVDVSVLRLLRAVTEEGSVSAAARRLGISQPAASQQLRRAERELGTALVERVGRRSRPTEPGQVLARHAVTVENALRAADSEVRAVAGLRSGTVRLVAFPSASADLVPRALAAMAASQPGVRVTLDELEPPQSLQQLRDGGCDVVVAFHHERGGRPPADYDALLARPLFRDEVRVALPRDHRLAAGPAVQVRDLAAESWIAGCPRCRGHLVTVADDAGYAPRIGYATDDYVAVLGLVAAGLGVAMLPGLVERTTRHDDVVVLPMVPAQARMVLAVTTPDLARVPPVALLLDELSSAAAPAPPGR